MGELGVEEGAGPQAAAELMAAVAQADSGAGGQGVDFPAFLDFCRKVRLAQLSFRGEGGSSAPPFCMGHGVTIPKYTAWVPEPVPLSHEALPVCGKRYEGCCSGAPLLTCFTYSNMPHASLRDARMYVQHLWRVWCVLCKGSSSMFLP